MPIHDLSKLRLTAGLSINIELPEAGAKRYQGTLIGFVPNRSVLVTTPMLGENRPLLLRKEQTIICRFFSHKVACAFSAQVVHLCTTPIHYFHLGWPRQVEVGTVRKSERVVANLKVSVVNQTDSSWQRGSGAVVDLSTTGARLECMEPIGAIGDIILISGKVVVGHVTRLISIEASIRAELNRFEVANSTAAYGIEFKYVSDIDFLALQAFVNGQVAKGAGR
ncbi:flagellar brake protein [Reinekea sp.]|jgi:c-di-GMP-binding flagellar brake protein YcgR|uniref:flagellar brake protein n=1 Tax=Reinekea sp. TaxID=1970455 RepID=UPI00398A3461